MLVPSLPAKLTWPSQSHWVKWLKLVKKDPATTSHQPQKSAGGMWWAEKRQDRERISWEMQNKLPGLPGLVVTRARQRTCYSINEAAGTSARLTPARASSVARHWKSSRERITGSAWFCCLFTPWPGFQRHQKSSRSTRKVSDNGLFSLQLSSSLFGLSCNFPRKAKISPQSRKYI